MIERGNMGKVELNINELTAIKTVLKHFIDFYKDGSIEIESPSDDISKREFLGSAISAYMKIFYSLNMQEAEAETEDEKGE